MFIVMCVVFGVGVLAACVACGDAVISLKTYIPIRVRAVALVIALGCFSVGLILTEQMTGFAGYGQWGAMLGIGAMTFAALVASGWKGLARKR